jgi:translation elongation factor EF-G
MIWAKDYDALFRKIMVDQVEEARATLVERIAELDDDLTVKFLEGEEISIEDLKVGCAGLLFRTGPPPSSAVPL